MRNLPHWIITRPARAIGGYPRDLEVTPGSSPLDVLPMVVLRVYQEAWSSEASVRTRPDWVPLREDAV